MNEINITCEKATYPHSALSSVNVANYKCLQNIIFADLAMVNLFVGDNNCGKSTALEACSLADSDGKLISGTPTSLQGLSRLYTSQFAERRNSDIGILKYLRDIEPDAVDVKTAEDTYFIGMRGRRLRTNLVAMGNGVRNLFAYYLDFKYSDDTAFFLDDFENSLGRTLQRTMWKMVFDFAKQGKQFFISTHSLECLQHMHEVYSSMEQGICPESVSLPPLALYRLSREDANRKVKRFGDKATNTLIRADLDPRYASRYGTEKLLKFTEAGVDVRYPHP